LNRGVVDEMGLQIWFWHNLHRWFWRNLLRVILLISEIRHPVAHADGDASVATRRS